MKVTGNTKNPAQTSKSVGGEALVNSDNVKRTKAQDAKTSYAAGATKVDISSRAADISKAKALATPSNSVDEAKVARLQKMIDEGKYKIDADAIADRLVDEQMKMPS